MLKGVRVSEQFDYISEKDEHKSEQEGATVFVIGTLPVDIRTMLQDGVMGFDAAAKGSLTMNINRQHLEAVRFGLKDVRNFSDENGKLLKYESEKVNIGGREYTQPTLQFLNHFPSWLLTELGKKVLGANVVTGQEIKN